MDQVVGKTGTTDIPTDPMPVEACDLMVILKDKDEWTTANTREALADSMAKALEVVAGVSFGFLQPIQMRFNELMSGAKQDVVLKIYGDDLDDLTRYADRVGAICRTVGGAEDIYVEQVSGLPQIVMDIDRQQLARYGLSVEEVNATMRAGFAGQEAGMLYEGERRFSIVVRLEQGHRQSIEDLQRLFVTNSNGVQVPLGQVADIRLVDGPNESNAMMRNDGRPWPSTCAVAAMWKALGKVKGMVACGHYVQTEILRYLRRHVRESRGSTRAFGHCSARGLALDLCSAVLHVR